MSERGKSGIYAIVNTTNGKRYVGQAASIGDRWLYHRSSLTRGKHHSRHLQSAWSKYGANVFAFVVLEYVQADKGLLAEREQFHMNAGALYNLAPAAASTIGLKHPPRSEEFRRAMSERKKGFKHKPETVEMLRTIAEQKRADGTVYRQTGEHREKLRLINTGKTMTPEAIAKSIAGRAGYKPSAETIAKQANANRGKKRTPEQCARIAEAKKGHGVGLKQSPELVEKRIASLRGRKRPQPVVNAMHEALRATRQPTIEAICLALKEDPFLNQTELAIKLKCGRSTIRKYKKVLIEQGRI